MRIFLLFLCVHFSLIPFSQVSALCADSNTILTHANSTKNFSYIKQLQLKIEEHNCCPPNCSCVPTACETCHLTLPATLPNKVILVKKILKEIFDMALPISLYQYHHIVETPPPKAVSL